MNDNQLSLEKYVGRKSRHECPACHGKYCFTYYIDGSTHQIINKQVGRCDHESSCGYHYTPKEYFRDNPEQRSILNTEAIIRTPVRVEQPKEPGRIPKQYIIESLGYKSNFIVFLCSLFDKYTLESPTLERLMNDYYLGCSKNGSIIYWQVDINNRIRTGKMMQYNPTTGKRVKNADGSIDWVHAKLKRDKVLSDNFNLVQCLFGEHLLTKYPNKIVALVESEKSALIGSGVYSNYIWLATGGKSQMSHSKLSVLKGRTVVMFPDADAYTSWCEKAKEMASMGVNVTVSDVIEKNASKEDRDAQIDIADWLIRNLKAIPEPEQVQFLLTPEEKALRYLGTLNPNVYTLINALGLVGAMTGEKLRTQIN